MSDSRSKGVHNVRSIRGGLLNNAEPHAQEIDKVKENTEKMIIKKIQKILLRRAMILYIKTGGGIIEIDNGGPQTCIVAVGTQSSVRIMEDWYKKGLVNIGN